MVSALTIQAIKQRDLITFIIGIVSGFILFWGLSSNSFDVGSISTSESIRSTDNSGITIPMEPFPEQPWRTPATLAARVVTSTPFARFEIHKVKTESGAIINDWLWVDERSHVNILVHLKEENKYLLFKQKKYGLDREYYALIGGLFNQGETAKECARRELMEETGLEPEELIDLGSYRVQVNRGGGILYAFLARNCITSKLKKISDDYEKQKPIKLTKHELMEIALKGDIGEAQWVATAALGILHEEHKDLHNQEEVK